MKKEKLLALAPLAVGVLPVLAMGAVVISGATITFDSSSIATSGEGMISALGGFMNTWQAYIIYIIGGTAAMFAIKWATRSLKNIFRGRH